MAAVFGSSPNLIVEEYAAGQSCDATELTGITTYLADGKCHKTGNTESYMATRSADGSAVVTTYGNSASCATSGAKLIVTAVQATGNSCATDGDGIVDTKVYGAGRTAGTPLHLMSIAVYDSNANACKSDLLLLVESVVTTMDACTETSDCTESSSLFTGVSCSTTLTYKNDMATAFWPKQYVIVEKYNDGKSCNPEELVSITTYRADTICHQTSSTASHRVTRSNSDLSAIIQVFTDSPSCTTTGTALALTRDMIVDNQCFDGADIGDIKVYSSWTSKRHLAMTMIYDSRLNGCNSPAVPSQQVTEMVGEDTCITSESCIGESCPYTRTICSEPTSYRKNRDALFGSIPYVTVASYAAGTSCAEDLSINRTYIADTKCHRSSLTSSFRAIRKADGSATIMTYANSTGCEDSSCHGRPGLRELMRKGAFWIW